MLPADLSYLSFKRTSVSVVHFVPVGKKKPAASSAIIQLCLNRTGQVMITSLLSLTILHTPSGLFALSFVQFGTLLLNGQSRFSLVREASFPTFVIGNPNTSANGCFGIMQSLE